MIRSGLTLLLLSSPLFSQVVLEQWGCDHIVSATNSNPVTLTCNTRHGFAPGATWKVQMYGGTGPWGALNTWVHTQLLTSLDVADTVAYVNDTTAQEVGQHVGFFCLNKTPEDAIVTAKTGNTLTVKRSSPMFHYLNAAIVSNSCDNQVFLNYNRPRLQTATATGPNTFTVPVNSSSFGALSGSIVVRRTTGIPRVYGTDYDGASNTVGLQSVLSNGIFTQSLPASDPKDPKSVIRHLGGTSMGLFIGKIPGSATVQSGIATLQLGEKWIYQNERPLAPGGFIYLDGFQNNRLNNGFLISSISPETAPTQFTVPVALADGVYPVIAGGARFGLPREGLLIPDFEPADNNGTWSYPGGLLQGFVKSGTWDPALNRLQIWMKVKNVSVPRRSDNGYIGTFGTYEKRHSNRVNAATPQYDEHWYHYYNHNLYDDVWVLATLNQHPTHQVGSSGGWDWGNDPTFAGFVGYPDYLGDATHYFDGMGRLYLDVDAQTVRNFSNTSISLGQINLDKVAAEPDSSVFTVLASWAPARFEQIAGCRYQGQSGQPECTGKLTRGPGFELTWNVPSFVAITYEVRRSTASMKAAGFSTGLCNNGTTTCTAGDIVGGGGGGSHNVIQWSSSNTAKTAPATTYFGIRPRFPVMSTSGKGVSPIWISTHISTDMAVKDHVAISGVAGNTAANQKDAEIVDVIPSQAWFRFDPVGTAICAISGSNPMHIKTCSPHGLTDGATVRVDQVQGIATANGTFPIHVVDATNVDLMGATGGGRYNGTPYGFIHGPGMLSSITASHGICTVATTAPHALKPSMWVMVAGSTNAALGQVPQSAEANWQITEVPDGQHFRFSCPKVPDGAYTQDHQKNIPFSMRVYPAIAVAGTGTGDWTSGGTIVSTEARRNFTEIKYNTQPPAIQ